MSQSHGFNSVHGRMPAVATGASAANRDLIYVGVSGDGDSLSIGLGQLCHAMRRNIDMLYVIENNGVYGLTKGQFSASADVGSKAKRGEENRQKPIDPVLLALALGAGFVARAFSGDKTQLVPILKAALAHKGFALIDVISPCVTFNDHEGSTKSYLYTRLHQEGVTSVDFVPLRAETSAELVEGAVTAVAMPDGSVVRFLKVDEDYDPTDRVSAVARIRTLQEQGVVPTGLLFIEESASDMHALNRTVRTPLIDLPYEALCPGGAALDALMEELR
jgi:2-oxoglutarate ferredoxin oxidoreductase subunit beta